MKRRLKLMKVKNETIISSDEMDEVYAAGGACTSSCACACAYEGTPGGSSTGSNWAANDQGGLNSPGASYANSSIKVERT